jgi:predicted lactoylglutathione lyase
MNTLNIIELKAFVPAKDFELSKQFYQDMGFTLCWSEGNLAGSSIMEANLW